MSTERRAVTTVPGWATVLGSTALVAAGAALGHFAVAIVTACVLAALVVDRTAFFTVLAQPPLITAAVGAATVALGKPLLSTVVELTTLFPHLVATILTVAVIVAVRQARSRRESNAQNPRVAPSEPVS